ncbi:FadR/GntR family transcriptional regulator [Bradyrhizobium sp. 31Argb]|uniref:FadR/GntR family transcriptional regulator n=1 Tax=unclassified Bradyrhizobium TaxID=2631580 RepID=UPI00102E7990|nr:MULTISPECIES: FadR/GntR family transcriptional regulator [unclassified Bradyrhizobium]MDI4233549.1 FadR/GntR family transcriptional regulator [Bradyrhizobium sp. Arg237L]TAI66496.1 GntR family transcriptional regulator [Bradyrhizobium sp. Leo170]
MDLKTQKALPRVTKVSLVDEVIAAIRTMLTEAWSVGSKLPSEQELSRQLGVGRSTVREALRVLEHLGLVESRSGLGTFVIEQRMTPPRIKYPQSPEALVQLYEFRRAIEIPSARLAAERRTAEQLANIKAAWRDCELAVKRDSADEFARLDFLFHAAIVKAAHNRFFLETFFSVQDSFANNVTLILGQGQLKSMLHFHDGLIEAIERRDAKAAARAAEDNFKETDVRIRLLLQSTNGVDKPKKR